MISTDKLDAEFHLTTAVKKYQLQVVFEPTRDKFVNPVRSILTLSDLKKKAEINYSSYDKSYTLVANPFSFARIENQDDGFQRLKSINRPQGYSGVSVGFVSAIVAVVGLLFVMTLLTLHKNQKITLPFIPSA